MYLFPDDEDDDDNEGNEDFEDDSLPDDSIFSTYGSMYDAGKYDDLNSIPCWNFMIKIDKQI